MTNAEKVITGLLSKVKIKKGGPRMLWIRKTTLKMLLIIAYKSGVVEGIKITAPSKTKKRGKRGKKCRT